MRKYYVDIIEYETDKTVESIVCEKKSRAEGVERFVHTALDHGKYYTFIEEREINEK